MQEILKIQNLKFQYPAYPGLDFPELLRGINLNINAGDFKIIIGKPEAGKSTLLKIILSLIPRYTQGIISGTLEFKGTQIDKYKPYELIEKIGSVFQDPDEQIFTTSCDTEIAFALESLGVEREEIKQRVDTALEILEIEKLKYRNPATLSGGEKKKLLMACLYAANPDLWLLDEILDELDPGAVKKIVQRLLREKRTVILFTSKMLDIFKLIPGNILVIKDGRLIDTTNMVQEAKEMLLIEEGLIFNPSESANRHSLAEITEPLVILKDLKYRYPGNDDFHLSIDNFHINRGEIVALAGRNGSGKSTLGKLIAGLRDKESGLLTVNEKNDLPCGYLFQNPDYQIFLPTVGEELSYGIKLMESQIQNTIDKFNLPDKNVPPTLMSYGARKRLQAAVYYLMERDLYILDEADAGLSLSDFENIINILHRTEKGIIIISHNMNLCSRYAHRVYLIESGRIAEEFENDLLKNLKSFFGNGESIL
ncbi:MAG: ATP-binding cassette domain-containing protein [Spirochaetia bacterium]|jgi:energy-coupling factor transporter ATP-binding protein EcfA2|nr:ATP-binding cassette domain-containing protein [Spirochaetia bacterium]